ncbi:MAG: peptidase and in kexin sedolisin [Myxococcales bacterium]|nr:peptidase and in kexin sedolisin [Myxococcales bacterium]
MKKNRALRTILLFALIGFAIAWYFKRDREQLVSNHQEPAPIAALDDEASGYAIAGQIVVDFKDDESHERIAQLGQSLGVTFKPASSSYVDADEIYTVDSGDGERLLALLRANPDVEAADFEFTYGLPEDALASDDEGIVDQDNPALHKDFPNDPRFNQQWHLQQIHMMETWKAAQGDGIVVAVIDTGVAKVPDLADTEIVGGWNFVNDSANATDDHGHGTHVAGTIAQSTHNGLGVAGVAFHAKIMPIKVLSARGSGSVSGIANGIRWAADHGAKVINMSLGGPMASSVLSKAVKYAHDKGVVVVCAAGNDGRGKVSYPAAYPHAIAVAATQFDETTTFYSNWGKEIDVAAPGGNTRVDQNGDGQPDGVLQNTIVPSDISRNDYLWFMGTSMASPHVAGVAALIMGQGVTDPDAVEKVLKETSRQPKAGKKDAQNRYGAGIVDAAAAVRKTQVAYGGYELGAALGFLGLMLIRLRRVGRAAIGLGVGGFGALVVGASGLFFLPQLFSVPAASVLAHGFPAWEPAALGSAGAWLFHSALAPIGAMLMLYGSSRGRRLAAGFALGVGAHLAFVAVAGTVAIPALWLAMNALAALGAGYVSLKK